MIEHICDRGYLDFEPILLDKTFNGKWNAAQNKVKEAYNWTSGENCLAYLALDMATEVTEKQQVVIDFNRSRIK